MKCAWLIAALALAACGNEGGNQPPVANEAPPAPASPAVRELRQAALALQLRDDKGAKQVEIQFVQIGVGIESGTRERLTLPEAEELAARVFAEARDGADFDTLAYQHSWEMPSLGRRPGAYLVMREKGESRQSVVAATMFSENLQKAFWRLDEGEIGAVEFHRRDCDTGYFVVRRLTAEEATQDNPANFEPSTPQVAAMRQAATDLMRRPELDVETVKVQHLLIGRYAPGTGTDLKPLKPVPAEETAAELFSRAVGGEDFDQLVKARTYDSHPGIYSMTRTKGAADARFREEMVAAFWKAAWRLKPGEVGVTLYDRYDSPFGYHIIKRLE